MKKTIKIFLYVFKLKRFIRYFVMGLTLFLLIFSVIGCQKEEPDGVKIQKSDAGISISGKLGDKSINIEKPNKSDKGISVNGKSGDSSFNFGNSNASEDSKIKEFIQEHENIVGIVIMLIFGGAIIMITSIIERIFFKNNNKTMIESSTVSVEKNEKIKYDNEVYNKKLSKDKIKCDYKEKSSELNKIYNLYKNKIYSEQEYKNKKEKWIESLKILSFNMVEIDFLNEIIVFVNDGIIENRELETIKYIVSGEYTNDKYKKQQEKKIKAEVEARKKREETINNIKNKTKEITVNTISKISSVVSNNSNTIIVADDQVICECGAKFEEEDVFCTNCGKKLK